MEQFERIAKECRYIPTPSEILAEIFSEYQFVMGGAPMTAQEVFNDVGLLPVFAFLAQDRMSQLELGDLKIEHHEDDISVVGFTAKIEESTPIAQSTLWLLTVNSIAKEVFGSEPSPEPINLDPFYDWIFNPDGEPPKLWVKNDHKGNKDNADLDRADGKLT